MENHISNNIPTNISVTRRLINNYLVHEMNKVGMENIATSHGDIIVALFNSENLTLKQLSIRIRRDKSTVTALVSKLVKSGYVKLVVNEQDRRSKYIYLTEKGMRLEKPFIEISNNLNKILLKDLDENEVLILIKLLNKIKINFLNEMKNEVEK